MGIHRAIRRPSSLSTVLVTAGVVVELAGLFLDARLHQADPTLVQREALTSLSNPGHALFGGGLVMTISGLAVRAWSGVSRRYPDRRGALVMGFAALLSWAASVGVPEVGAHPHVDAGAGRPERSVVGHGGTTHSAAEVPITWSRLQEINAILVETKAATERFRDVDVAIAAGYAQEGPSLAGAGAHFVNRRLLDRGVFDHLHPSVLLYERQPDWSLELVGVAWFLPTRAGDDTAPTSLTPLAVWHHHTYAPPGICVGPRGMTNLLGDACTADGGRFWTESPWMLHAWLFRDSPNGVFSLENPAVVGTSVDADFSP